MFFTSFLEAFTRKHWWNFPFPRCRMWTRIVSLLFDLFIIIFLLLLLTKPFFFLVIMDKFEYYSIRKAQKEKVEKTKAEKALVEKDKGK